MGNHTISKDVGALTIVLGTFLHWLPEVVLTLPSVYYGMLIWTWIVNKQWESKK